MAVIGFNSTTTTPVVGDDELSDFFLQVQHTVAVGILYLVAFLFSLPLASSWLSSLVVVAASVSWDFYHVRRLFKTLPRSSGFGKLHLTATCLQDPKKKMPHGGVTYTYIVGAEPAVITPKFLCCCRPPREDGRILRIGCANGWWWLRSLSIKVLTAANGACPTADTPL